MELKDTITMMQSEDFVDRLRAEYWQAKIRLEKLHAANVKADAERRLSEMCESRAAYHTNELMHEQEEIMRRYTNLLELRAELGRIAL